LISPTSPHPSPAHRGASRAHPHHCTSRWRRERAQVTQRHSVAGHRGSISSRLSVSSGHHDPRCSAWYVTTLLFRCSILLTSQQYTAPRSHPRAQVSSSLGSPRRRHALGHRISISSTRSFSNPWQGVLPPLVSAAVVCTISSSIYWSGADDGIKRLTGEPSGSCQSCQQLSEYLHARFCLVCPSLPLLLTTILTAQQWHHDSISWMRPSLVLSPSLQKGCGCSGEASCLRW
jgi:hypothetical protein